ncbi:MAG: Ig-like domain-containing protein [Desulfamplus sp.]|nr:Ig-like domain-containing protein [Desulfamplus sp.]
MKKVLLSFNIAVIVFLIIVVGVVDSFAVLYEKEFNDTSAKALNIGAPGTQIVGNMWHALDYDWYSFKVDGNTTFKLSVVYGDSKKEETVSNALYLEIRDTSNNIIEGFPVDFGKKKDSYQGTVVITSAGTYYLVVFCPSPPNYKKDNYNITLYDAENIDPSTEQPSDEPKYISLSLSKTSVKSDNADTTEITATVLDGYHVPVPDVELSVRVDAGQISNAFPVTDENGKAVILFSSGLQKNNGSIMVKISINGTFPLLSSEIPVIVSGSTLTVDPGPITNLEIGGRDTTTFRVTAKDASGNPISGADVKVDYARNSDSMYSDESGFVENIPFQGTTDYLGNIEIPLKAFVQGDLTLNVESLGITATQFYSVYSQGEALRIIYPEKESVSLYIYNNDASTERENGKGTYYEVIKVAVPDELVQDGHTIRFISTLGRLSRTVESDNGINTPVLPLNWVHPLDMDAQSEIVVAYKSDSAGVAVIYAYDVDNIVQNDSLSATIASPPEKAAQISIQAAPTVVSPSTGGGNNVSDVLVTVKNQEDQVVAGATVIFTLNNPTGGGETVTPSWIQTDSSGVARATFKSGSLTSGGDGVELVAKVLDADVSDITDSVKIVIGGTPGSIVIGRSTDISSDATNTYYKMPMSVLVADAGGHPVANQKISLNSWPLYYYTGEWVQAGEDKWIPETTGTYENEDRNKNLILDKGEDTNKDGRVTPPNTAAGSLPETVTTDENGFASFELIYLKEYAVWIKSEIRATAIVAGSETKSVLEMRLPYAIGEEKLLPSSPFNDLAQVGDTPDPDDASSDAGSIEFVSAQPEMIALAGIATVTIPSFSTVTFQVKDTLGNPIESVKVSFELTTVMGGITISREEAYTDSAGVVQIVVNSGTVPTHVRVKATVKLEEDDKTLITMSDSLVISTGMPDQDSFSLAADNFTPEAWNWDGEEIKLTVRAADHFNNPVPDGTAVYFTAEGGSVDPSCSITSGACTVTWRSQNPRPSDGKVRILATAIGEESFVDLNGNGLYDPGDTLGDDLGEAFLDINDNEVYDSATEEFFDLNNDGIHTKGNNKYNGTLCSGGNHCTTELVHVRKSLSIYMSGSKATISSGSISVSEKGYANHNVTIKDVNKNPMPKGTSVSFETTSSLFTIAVGGDGYTVDGDTDFALSIDGAEEGAGSGTIIVKVITPKGIITQSTISVTVTSAP